MKIIKRAGTYLKLFLIRMFYRDKTFMVNNTKKTLSKLLNAKCSISRFGDGEFNLILGNDIPFQKSSELLSKNLLDVLINKEQKKECLIGVPIAMFDLKGFNLKSCNFWYQYAKKNKKLITQLMNDQLQYYDSQVTRIFANRTSKKYSKAYFSYWVSLFSGKDLLIVEGKETRFGVGNELLSKASSIKRIECPTTNAFDKYELIKKEILKHECDIVLVALGPTATLLSYDLSNKKRIIDIGNLDVEYEWFLQGRKSKIEGKYSIEVPHGTEVSSIYGLKYDSEIIKEID